MPRPSRTPKLPPSAQPIERIRCAACGRTWAVYQGKTPRMWSSHGGEVFCDRRPCNAELDQRRKMARAV